jgi:cytochrome c oxidase assembly factor CtaG
MKALHRNWNELIHDCMIVVLLTGTVGIALKFTTFFDKWVYFPSFPNICDAAFLILSVAYLTWLVKRPRTFRQNKLSQKKKEL